MRIVQVGQYPLDPSIIRGGVESSIDGLARELSKDNDVYVMDVPRMNICDSVERRDQLEVYRFTNNGIHQKDAVDRLSDICATVARIKPDVCHIHGTTNYCWRFFQEVSRMGIPVIVTVHGLLNVEKWKMLKRKFSLKVFYQFVYQSYAERRLLNAANVAIVDTKYVADMIVAYHLRHTPRIAIIPQGIDQRFFSISCSKSSLEILSVGAISRRKGHLFLIKAFELLCERMPGVHLTICGSLTDKTYYDELSSYVFASSCKERIRIVTDVSKDVLDSFYREARVFALHSQEESQGIVLAEAMATGLPVVATRVGGIPDVIHDQETGLLSEFGDVRGFADALFSFLDSKERWEDLSENCQIASRDYSWTSIAHRIMEIYNSLL